MTSLHLKLVVAALGAVYCVAGSAQTAAAPESYTAETTYAKLAPKYPFIKVAGSEVPASVEALRGITYVRHGGRDLQLDLYLPKARAGKPLPGVVFVHGGGWRTGVRANFAPMAIRMAERGYAAATVSYRLSPEAPYPAAIHDVKAALRWMRAHAGEYGIDPARLAVAGGSAGGQIASLVGVTNGVGRFDPDATSGSTPGAVSSAAQAIVNIDGLSDFTSEAARKYEDDPAKQPSSAGAWFGGRYAEKEALWREASPTFYVNAATPPILFIGSGQARFSVGREEMIAKMDAVGVARRVLVLPETPHSFWLFDPWLAPTVEATVRFLDEQMRGGAPLTAADPTQPRH
jgi:acetyl esterase/lipase